MKNRLFRTPVPVLLFLFCAAPAVLTARPVFWLDLETGAAFTGYNDVQIPADTGTAFSLAEDLDPRTVWFYRIQLGMDWGRHSLQALYAPLRILSNGTAGGDISFNGELFTAGTALEGEYIFNSYRLSWAYTLMEGDKLRFAAGITGKIRDASIGLRSATAESVRTNLGFVPLIHLEFQWRFAPELSFLLAGDGLAAPQGRAEDFLAALLFSPASSDMEFRLGYRILEGGSDGGGSVYTFSLFHYLGAGIRYRL